MDRDSPLFGPQPRGRAETALAASRSTFLESGPISALRPDRAGRVSWRAGRPGDTPPAVRSVLAARRVRARHRRSSTPRAGAAVVSGASRAEAGKPRRRPVRGSALGSAATSPRQSLVEAGGVSEASEPMFSAPAGSHLGSLAPTRRRAASRGPSLSPVCWTMVAGLPPSRASRMVVPLLVTAASGARPALLYT